MTTLTFLAAAVWLGSTIAHLGSLLIVATWLSRTKGEFGQAESGHVTIVRPVCGLEEFTERAIRSSFALLYTSYDLIFCAHHESDPAIPLIRRLIFENPHVPAQLMIGNDEISGNPKLNNIAKCWPHVSGEWLVLCDDNIDLPPNYLSRLFAAWTSSTGAVSTINLGTEPGNFWAEVECAFLNAFQARWYLATAAVGQGFASGKTIMVRAAEFRDPARLGSRDRGGCGSDATRPRQRHECKRVAPATTAATRHPLSGGGAQPASPVGTAAAVLLPDAIPGRVAVRCLFSNLGGRLHGSLMRHALRVRRGWADGVLVRF